MKKFIKIVDRVIEYIQWIFIAAMAYFAILSLLEWWGQMWVIAIGVFIAIVLVIVPVIYRLLSGKWPTLYMGSMGFLVGCPGMIVLVVALLVFPVTHWLVEGTWHTAYLIALGVFVGLDVIQDMLEAFKKRKIPD